MPVIASSEAADQQHLVLCRERTFLGCDARRRRAGDELVPLADQVLHRRDAGGRVGLVVDVGQVDLFAVDLAGAVRGVLDPVLQALDVLGAVGGEEARAGVDDPDVVLAGRGVARAGGDGARGGEERHRPHREQRDRETATHVRVLHVEDWPPPDMRGDSGVGFIAPGLRLVKG
jgi:hypothetical protein